MTARRHARRSTVAGLIAVLVLAGCTTTGPDSNSAQTGSSSQRSSSAVSSTAGTGLIPPDPSGSTSAVSPTAGSAGVPGWPQAPRLAWLEKAHDDDGVRVGIPGATLWQGRVPGEYALLTSGGYQWFGSDGSMVGCNAQLSCVGFGADGTIAITARPDGQALVYDVRGGYVGVYRTDGRKTGSATSAPPLVSALTASDVNVSALVATGTGRLPFAGGVTGDPHLITAGGVRFTTQVTGQYVARGGDPDHAVQLRFAPVPHRRDVSLVSDVVIGSWGDTIDLSMAGDIVVNHVARPASSTFEQFGLGSGAEVGVWPRDASRVVTVAVVWPDTASVVISANPALGLTVVAHLPRDPASVGLFGSGALGAGSDLVGRNGVSKDVAGVVSSWQVTRAELLFDAQVSPDPGFPQGVATVAPATISAAQAACRAAGVMQLEDRAACVFDAALTGDDGFVAGHRLMAVPAESTLVPSAALALFPALVVGSLNPSELPAGGLIDFTLNSGQSEAFRVPVSSGGTISLVHQRGCSASSTPGIGTAALRIFDSTGHPVSPRLALCGREEVSDLEPGTYSLVVASSTAHSPTHARLQVSVLP